MLVGSGLHFWTKGILEQNRRLTTAGPYRWTRNPFYLANLLIDLGLCFVIGRFWVAFVFVPIWAYAYHETIRREEAHLDSLFPSEFPRYRESVPRLLPTGRRLDPEHAQGVFSFSNESLAKGSEYARLIGIWLAPATIWAAALVRREGLGLFEPSNEMTLALLVVIPVAWVFKLALAERFRRPETALLPFAAQPIVRLATGLLFMAVAFIAEQPWVWNGPLLWIGLMGLESSSHHHRYSDEEDAGAARSLWQYFPPIVAGGLLISLCVELMIHLTMGA